MGILMAAVGLSACETNTVVVPDPGGGVVAPPVGLDVRYYDRTVVVTWQLAASWNGEPFRVYAATGGSDFIRIAEVTNCSQSLCSYSDVNIEPGVTYTYYVSAVGFDGVEAASADAIPITVPGYTPPPVPGRMEVVALDGANYLRWDDAARSVADFSFYRVYLFLDGESFLLGETDSEGFLDELAENGLTYEYFVTALDEFGHESEGSGSGFGTPRPDYHGEFLYDFFSVPSASGFIFQEDESFDPVVSGTDPLRHFRLETDAQGWWLVPGPGVTVYPLGFETTALRCGPGADATCIALDEAPVNGYVAQDLFVEPQTTYVLQVPGNDNRLRYAAVRIEVLGFDQDDAPLMIFDWSYQLQPGNPALAPVQKSRVRAR
jgi:hypothetical protein